MEVEKWQKLIIFIAFLHKIKIKSERRAGNPIQKQYILQLFQNYNCVKASIMRLNKIFN